MRINVSEEYREEFEEFIRTYQKLCDRIIDLVVDNVPFDELITYCICKHPDVMLRLTDTVSSSDIMRVIVNKCSITYITPLEDVIQYYRVTIEGIGMITNYQRSLDEYLSKLRARYLLGPSKDVNVEEIIFILHWTPDDTSFRHIKRLLYEAFHHLHKNIIVQDIGKKNLHLLIIYHNTVTHSIAACLVLRYNSLFSVLHSHTHTTVSVFHCCFMWYN